MDSTRATGRWTRTADMANSRAQVFAWLSAWPNQGISSNQAPEEALLVIRAYVLIQTHVGKAAQVTRDLGRLDGVLSVEQVAGPYDVVARTEAPSLDKLGRLVATGIHAVDGITRTVTCAIVAL